MNTRFAAGLTATALGISVLALPSVASTVPSASRSTHPVAAKKTVPKVTITGKVQRYGTKSATVGGIATYRVKSRSKAVRTGDKVRVQRLTKGVFKTLKTVRVKAKGTWTASVTRPASGAYTYRAKLAATKKHKAATIRIRVEHTRVVIELKYVGDCEITVWSSGPETGRCSADRFEDPQLGRTISPGFVAPTSITFLDVKAKYVDDPIPAEVSQGTPAKRWVYDVRWRISGGRFRTVDHAFGRPDDLNLAAFGWWGQAGALHDGDTWVFTARMDAIAEKGWFSLGDDSLWKPAQGCYPNLQLSIVSPDLPFTHQTTRGLDGSVALPAAAREYAVPQGSYFPCPT